MEKAVWKDVVGYEDIYEVSNTGLVRSHKNKITYTERHGVRHWKPRILKDKTPNGRDVRVSLWKNGKSKDYLVHRLVAEAFIPKVEGKTCINHIDGNPKNNRVSNLEWCNHNENNNHAFDNDLIKTGKKIILLDKQTHEPLYFRSLSRASLFLGHNDGYLSNALKQGINEIDGYEIFVKAN